MLARIQRGSNTYAVYELNHDGASIDEVSVCMINNNQNSAIGLAPIQFEAINGAYTNMQFDVTGKVTRREYIGRNITQDAFKRMMLNLIDTIEGFDEYMIDVRQVLLNIDCVFINELDHSVSFICVAVKEAEQSGDLFEFFRSIVENCHVAASVNEVSYFHCVWNVIRSGSGFSLSNMKIAMATAKADGTAPVQQQKPQSMPTAAPAAPVIPKRPEEPETITVSSQPQMTQPQPVVPPIQPNDADKKKGLFGGLFSQKKKKPEPAGSYQGGLAGLKNGPQKPGQPPAAAQQPMPGAPVQQRGAAAPVKPAQNAQQPMQQAPAAFGGTTVLNGGMAKMPQPAAQPVPAQHPAASVPMGTTVLNQPMPTAAPQTAPQQTPQPAMNNTAMFQQPMPGAAPQPARAPQQAASAPLGTTVLNQPMTAPAPQQTPQPAMNNTAMFNQPMSSAAPMPQQAPASAQNPGGFANAAPGINKPQNPAPMTNAEATVLQGGFGGATTVLVAPTAAGAVLIRTKNGDRIPLNKPVIRLGRDRSDLDYCINDNTAVGHSHANILQRGADYYIVDQNSRNHTFVNGMMIQGGMETRLFSGDKVRLANEDFEFRIM